MVRAGPLMWMCANNSIAYARQSRRLPSTENSELKGGRKHEIKSRLANKIRVLKGVDPTLGLYAAYAYSDAGIRLQVRSVRDFMRDDLGGDLFDVAMLARLMPASDRVAPFCPMLTQGWNLLEPKIIRAFSQVSALRPHLRQALWTTFDAEGFDIAREALQRGNLP